MSILADVFMLLSYPGCHSIQCFKLCEINEKIKVWQEIYLQLSCICKVATHSVYSITTYFLPRNRLIYRRKTKDDKNFRM